MKNYVEPVVKIVFYDNDAIMDSKPGRTFGTDNGVAWSDFFGGMDNE